VTGEPLAPGGPLRVALVADLRTEAWPSMDLVAAMLESNLAATGAFPHLAVDRLCPTLRHRGPRIGRYLNRFWDYPRWIRPRATAFDVFHVIDHSYAHLLHELPGDQCIVTCHDIDAFLPLVAPELTRSRLPKVIVRRILSGMRSAALVACPSEATREDLSRYGLVDADRLFVVPNGIHPAFTSPPDQMAERAVASLVGKDAGHIDLLHVGSTIPRKRIDRLLEIVSSIRRRESRVRLLKAGGVLTVEQIGLARSLGLEGSIVSLPFLDPPQLAALYRRATVLLMTSEREGFGLPVIEALACGTSVVTSDLPVFREVGGDIVQRCGLDDTPGWTERVLTLVDEHRSSPANEMRRALNRRQAERFSWRSYASSMAAAYKRLEPRRAA
jgi:glycosyltransferase involved in cell wall biosynthesis